MEIEASALLILSDQHSPRVLGCHAACQSPCVASWSAIARRPVRGWQHGGEEASVFNRGLVARHAVRLELGLAHRDSWGRLLEKVLGVNEWTFQVNLTVEKRFGTISARQPFCEPRYN